MRDKIFQLKNKIKITNLLKVKNKISQFKNKKIKITLLKNRKKIERQKLYFNFFKAKLKI